MSQISGTKRLSLNCLISAVIGAAWYCVLGLLIRVVRTIQQGDPFVDANIGRMRAMWILIASAEIFRMIVIFILGVSGGGISGSGEGRFDLIDVRIGTWFLVFVIAVLSEAFRKGAELRRDQELTI